MKNSTDQASLAKKRESAVGVDSPSTDKCSKCSLKSEKYMKLIYGIEDTENKIITDGTILWLCNECYNTISTLFSIILGMVAGEYYKNKVIYLKYDLWEGP